MSSTGTQKAQSLPHGNISTSITPSRRGHQSPTFYLAVQLLHCHQVQGLEGVPSGGDEVQADVDPCVMIVEQRTADFQLLLQVIFKLRINVLNYRPVTKTIPLATQRLEIKITQLEGLRNSHRHIMILIKTEVIYPYKGKAWPLRTDLLIQRFLEPPEAVLQSLMTVEHGR